MLLRYSTFFLTFLVIMQWKYWLWPVRKLRSFSTFMRSRTEKQIITIHILRNILRSKGNKTREFGQLIEYNTRNTFFEKLYTKCGGKPSPSPFYWKPKLSISLDQQSEILNNLFLLYVLVKDYRNILKLRWWALAFTSYKAS